MASKMIYIVDDEAVIRASTVSLLRARGDLEMREFASGEALLAALDGLAAGCVLLDAEAGGTSAATMLEALSARKHDFRTIIVSASGDVTAAVAAFRAGAADFLDKPYAMEPLMCAIDRAFHLLVHGEEMPSSLARAQAAMARLTAPEADVLGRLMHGHTNQEIARDTGADERAVQTMRARALAALEAPSLLAAIRTAMIAEAGSADPR